VYFTRRLHECRRAGALLAGAFALGASMTTSCSSESADVQVDSGSFEGNVPVDASAASHFDALNEGGEEAGPDIPDTTKSDAGRAPVVCSSDSCAVALTTTLGTGSEGYCALLHDGTVACWGQNAFRQLGRGADAGTTDSPVPQRVANITNIVAIDHSCALDSNGAMWGWGKGTYLTKTTPALTTEPVPVKVAILPATMIAVHGKPPLVPNLPEPGVACAVIDGEVNCWGMNHYAQIAPIDNPLAAATTPRTPTKVPLPPGAKIRRLVVGFTSFVLREDGTPLSWGAGDGIGRVSSLDPDPYPAPVELVGVSDIDVKDKSGCAVAEGRAYCWGVGDTSRARALPVLVPTPEPVVQISTTSVENAPQLQRGCACGVSGAVCCWGNNQTGQLGDGTTTRSETARAVVGLPAPAAEVRAAPVSTCALLTNGKIYCWGSDANGQLGGGAAKSTLVPREVMLP
jgi:alpha-tubulin suppressor-like RCC1 family protein